MSRKSARNIERIDYKIYNKTGKKVAKEGRDLTRIQKGFENLSKMAENKLIDDEIKERYKFELNSTICLILKISRQVY